MSRKHSDLASNHKLRKGLSEVTLEVLNLCSDYSRDKKCSPETTKTSKKIRYNLVFLAECQSQEKQLN